MSLADGRHGRRSPRLLMLTSVLLPALGPMVWQPQVLETWHSSFYLLFLNQKLSLILKELYVVSTGVQQSTGSVLFQKILFLISVYLCLHACICTGVQCLPAEARRMWRCPGAGITGGCVLPRSDGNFTPAFSKSSAWLN